MAAGYNPSQGLKCCSSGCQQQGLTSKDGYCNSCFAKNCNPPAEDYQWNDFNAGKGDVQNPPALRAANDEPGGEQKCRKCKEFFAN